MRILSVLLMFLLAACAAENDTRAAEKAAAPAPQPATPAPAVVAEPAPPPPPKEVVVAPKGEPGKVDTSCATSADCAVKDVGNCCGYFPACVNRDSPVFPEQVRAACEAEGRASICGFREITACECVAGACQAAGGAGSAAQ